MTAAAGGTHSRITDIELLRGIAILFVLVQHMPINLFSWTNETGSRLYDYFGFWTGVDLFFAISGFVIARSLLPMLNATHNNTEFFNAALAFWVRRAWRLLPSAWLWLAIIMLAVVLFNRSGAFGTIRANFEASIAAILDMANFRLMIVFGRFPSGASFPYWSLSLEEQFYILLPFLVFFSRRWLPVLLGSVVLAQFFLTRTGPSATIGGLVLNQLRSDAISLGVLIAIWSQHPTYKLFEPTGLRQHGWIRFILLGGLILCLAAVGSQVLHIVWFQVGVVALISGVLVFIASFDADYLFPDGVVKRMMLWVGSRSYALYLVHIPVYCFTREIWFRIEPAGTVFNSAYVLRFMLTAAVAAVVLAEANYRIIEVPLRRRGAQIAGRLLRRLA